MEEKKKGVGAWGGRFLCGLAQGAHPGKMEEKEFGMAKASAAEGELACSIRYALSLDDKKALAKIFSENAGALRGDAVLDDGVPAFWLACKKGSVRCAGMLLDLGADPGAPAQKGAGRLAVHMLALCDNKKDGVLLLLDKIASSGADLDARDDNGKSPLMLALAVGKEKFAKALLEAGARIDAPDAKGDSALVALWSSERYPSDNARSARWLLENGADPNFRGAGGRTALHWACKLSGGNVDLARLLAEAGGRMDLPDGQGMSPWDYLEGNGRVPTGALGWFKALADRQALEPWAAGSAKKGRHAL